MGTLVGIIAFVFLAYHFSIGLLRAFFSFFSIFVFLYFAGTLANTLDLDPVLSMYIVIGICFLLAHIINSINAKLNK